MMMIKRVSWLYPQKERKNQINIIYFESTEFSWSNFGGGPTNVPK